MGSRRNRILLAGQECHGNPGWRDENKREATWAAMGGSVAENWLGQPDESEWEDPDGGDMDRLFPISLIGVHII